MQGCDQRHLRQLAPRTQPLVIRPQPGIFLDRHQGGHPQRGTQPCMADWGEPRMQAAAFPGLPNRRNNADIGRQCCGAPKVLEIAELRDQPRGGLRANPIDGGEQQAHFVVVKRLLNVPFEFVQAPAQSLEIFADIADLHK